MNTKQYFLKNLSRSGAAIFIPAFFSLVAGCYDNLSLTNNQLESRAVNSVPNKNPKQLLSINSLTINKISFAKDSQNVPELERKEIYNQLVEAFKSQLNIDVYDFNNSRAPAADGKVDVTITSYSKRLGSRVGSTKPAEVGFDVRIIDSKTNTVVWYNDFHFQDKPLTDNLFEINDRFHNAQPSGFRDASRLLHDGFKESARQFAELRLKQFS